MANKTFDLFCPECNILVEGRTIADGPGGYRSTAPNPMVAEDAEYYGERYSICLCPRCNHPFLVEESMYGVPGEFEIATDHTVLYPSESKLSIGHLPEKIQTAYEKALRSFRVVLYEACVLMCRKCLEITCKSFGINERTIYGSLQKLHEEGYIDSRLLNIAHEIRLIGNEAAHGSDDEITKDDARDVLDFTEAILIYLFSLGKKLEMLRERRGK